MGQGSITWSEDQGDCRAIYTAGLEPDKAFQVEEYPQWDIFDRPGKLWKEVFASRAHKPKVSKWLLLRFRLYED